MLTPKAILAVSILLCPIFAALGSFGLEPSRRAAHSRGQI